MEYAHAKDDSALVERCIAKDASAWSELVGKHSGLIRDAIFNRARKYGVLLGRHEIEDITQDVLASIWKADKLSTIKNRDNISCWLAIVSGNAAAEYLNHKDKEEPLSDEDASCVDSPRDEEAILEIEKAVGKLPPRESLIIQLHLFHDKKYREIADMLDIPEGTVSSYVKRAKARLKKLLKNLQ